ncbi:hypothetical protein AVEN_262137-1, partial [Araneus ventricosus]
TAGNVDLHCPGTIRRMNEVQYNLPQLVPLDIGNGVADILLQYAKSTWIVLLNLTVQVSSQIKIRTGTSHTLTLFALSWVLPPSLQELLEMLTAIVQAQLGR